MACAGEVAGQRQGAAGVSRDAGIGAEGDGPGVGIAAVEVLDGAAVAQTGAVDRGADRDHTDVVAAGILGELEGRIAADRGPGAGQAAVVGDFDGTTGDRGGASIGVVAGEGQGAGAVLGDVVHEGADGPINGRVAIATDGEVPADGRAVEDGGVDAAGIGDVERGASVGIDAAVSREPDKAVVGVGAADVAQGAGAAHPGAGESVDIPGATVIGSKKYFGKWIVKSFSIPAETIGKGFMLMPKGQPIIHLLEVNRNSK